ncbi:MAG TPA: response regulator [Herpetosiphonaceae bacterium]
MVAQVQPDVVLMEVQMPLLDGIATTKRLRLAYPNVPIVRLTGGDDCAVLDGEYAAARGDELASGCCAAAASS